MGYKYALTGPPFNFQGTFSESQHNAFNTWVTGQTPSLPGTEMAHRIRAYQLRKTAGVLEQFYSTLNSEPLAPTFVKQPWKPGVYGHWFPAQREDHTPSVLVGQVKHSFRFHLQRQDDAVFHMNHLRNEIERQEDLAQYAFEATSSVPEAMSKIQSLFGRPEYQAVLVKDISDTYKGEPRFRVHGLDEPTQWEKEQHNHGATADSPLILGSQGQGS